MEFPDVTGPEFYPTPPTSEGSISSASSGTTAAGGNPYLIPVAPYLQYIIPAQREELAKREFELAMMEREVKLAELDAQRQKFLAPKRRPFTVPFVIPEAKMKMALDRFSRTLFRVGQDAAHDHPLAHLETMMGTDRIARMFKQGDTVLDIFGSPKRMAKLQGQQARSTNPKTFRAVCKLMSEKDYLRQDGWHGNEAHYFDIEGASMEEAFDVASWFAPRGDAPPRIMTMAIHTLYYMTDELIALLVSRPKTKMLALVHRHPAESGTLFLDELDYAKKDGMVEQVNRATGERYTHRDVSWLWTSTTKVKYTDRGAFVWTLHKVTPDTWIVEITACPMDMNERYVKRARDTTALAAMQEMNEHSMVPTPFPHPAFVGIPETECVMVAGIPVVRITGQDREIKVTSPELVEFLALHMVNKPRDAIRFADCTALAVAHVRDGMSFPGKLEFEVESIDLPGHVILGYLKAFAAELRSARSLPTFSTLFKEHNAHLAGHSLMVGVSDNSLGTRAAAQALDRFNQASKQGNTLDGVLHALNMGS